jgi:hypothetical protein
MLTTLSSPGFEKAIHGIIAKKEILSPCRIQKMKFILGIFPD